MSEVSVQILSDFKELFTGNEDAYGVHVYGEERDENGKRQGKASFTVTEPVTEELYKNHLEGIKGLGIIPINSRSLCKYTIIDVDIYRKEEIIVYVKMIYKNNFPLFPFTSKSGGLHIYTFFSDFIRAKDALAFTKKYMYLLGVSKDTELFPKQEVLTEAQVGNWVNLPYFSYDNTVQGLLDNNIKIMPLQQAIDEINKRKVDIKKQEEYFVGLPLSDAPPCLQAIYVKGYTIHRNDYLFSLARYLKSKYGDEFEQKVAEANFALSNPLPLNEVQTSIINSHKKKDYSYKCKEQPLCDLCNKNECSQREFGLGREEVSELNYEELTQFKTDPPYYKWKINGAELTFYDEADFLQQQAFRKLCIRYLHLMPYRLKDNTWNKIVNSALASMIIQEIREDEDVSPGALFREYLTEFLEERAQAANKEQIKIGRVYKDLDVKCYVFKSKNLLSFLTEQKRFFNYGYVEIQERLKKMGAGPKRYYLGKDTVRVWFLPFESLKNYKEEIDPDSFKIDFTEKDNYEDPFKDDEFADTFKEENNAV